MQKLWQENRSRHTAHDEMPSTDEFGRTKYDEMKEDGKMGPYRLEGYWQREKVSFLKKKNHHQNVLFIRVRKMIKLLFPAFVLTKEYLGKDKCSEITPEYMVALKEEIDAMRKRNPTGRNVSNRNGCNRLMHRKKSYLYSCIKRNKAHSETNSFLFSVSKRILQK